MHKEILITIGIILLFLGVGIQPAIAISNIEQNIVEETNDNGIFWSRGFIICDVWTENSPIFPTFHIPVSGLIVTCEDLDTDAPIRVGITKFGVKVFKFLPLGHDYKLTFYFSPKIEKLISNFDGFSFVYLFYDWKR